MFCFFLTSSIVALRVGRYNFPVEQLTHNGTNYKAELEHEILHFNFLAAAERPEGCFEEEPTVAVSVTKGDLEVCISLGILEAVNYSLIQDAPSRQPKGIKVVYPGDRYQDITFEILCNRVEKRSVRRTKPFEYLITWQHPAGCPRLSSTKSSKFSQI
ncbi:hypothetical protein BLNAU_6960 [Blattamonas nauphoetae]|uniref:Uncharacterized protein n=1 Tax=Blattamonas nauphoetae TaxID=2049346 RepID=A0ABQ9Y2S1_9EUKA|nr:hypothetical protein BLNAU_6960 [Blattamonas nauphoetae]